MAYTIISQNNSTTTLSDGVNTITVPSRVNLTSGNFTIVEVNNNMATLEDGDGNVYRDIPCVATLVDAGGGGSAVDSVNGKTGTVVLDAKDVHAVPQYTTMPTADSTNVGEIVQFTGATDATYTNGFFYKCVSESTEESYTGSVVDSTAELGTVTIDATSLTQWFQQTLAEAQNYPEDLPYFEGILNGTANGVFSYNNSTEWTFYDSTEGFKESPYSMSITQYPDLISFTGTATPGDTVEVAITPVGSTTYSWQQIDVQPAPEALPDQTGQSGKFLTTDGTDASWAAVNALQNTATGNQSFTVGGTPTNANCSMNIGLNSSVSGNYSLAIGRYATVTANNSVVIGGGTARGTHDVVLGNGSIANGCNGSIVIGNPQNITPVEESNVAVFTLNEQNYKILDSDGSIPTDRLAKNSIQHYTIMPAASPDLSGVIAQYVGATDGSYTNGYFYKCSQGTSSATASQTTGSSLSDVAVVVATFETQATDSGSYVFTYSAADSAWIHDYLITDLVDWGITYTGTPVDGDVITVVYDNGLGWTQTDVQPGGSSLPSQTGNAGKFLTTDGTDASWAAVGALPDQTGHSGQFLTTDGSSASWSNKKVIINNVDQSNTTSVNILGTNTGAANCISVGYSSSAGSNATSIGMDTKASLYGVSIGYNVKTGNSNPPLCCGLGCDISIAAKNAIQLGTSSYYQNTSKITVIATNSDANTMKVANANGNFEMMSADGTIPAARHASLPAADGTYVLKLVIASGVPTLSWVAE